MSKKVCYIDTNIFLRFLVIDKINPKLSQKARKIFQKIKNGEIVVRTNVCVISEIVYVLEDAYEINKDEVVSLLIPLINQDSIQVTDKELIINSLLIYAEKNVDFEDAFTYTQMKDQDIDQIYTFDRKHFKRFEDIEILTEQNAA